jgi:hypothetical protein
MIVRELLEMLDSVKPNKISDNVKMRWINCLEGRVHCEIFKEQPANKPYVVSENDELIVPDEFSDLYLRYLVHMVEIAYGDISIYKAAKAEFDEAFERYAKFVIRNRRP